MSIDTFSTDQNFMFRASSSSRVRRVPDYTRSLLLVTPQMTQHPGPTGTSNMSQISSIMPDNYD